MTNQKQKYFKVVLEKSNLKIKNNIYKVLNNHNK